MEYTVFSINKAKAFFEVSVEADGARYNVIYGEHPGGGFCAIPNHGIACEMASADDLFFNTEALLHRNMSRSEATAIACAIRDAAAVIKDLQ